MSFNIKIPILVGVVFLFFLQSNCFAGGKKFDEKDYLTISFEQLSGFEYIIPETDEEMKRQIKAGTLREQIPPEISALNNKKVSVQGFILPAELNGNKLKSFVVMPNQMGCCFGVPPTFNGWIYVIMTGEGSSQWAQDKLVTVYGTFHVGETIDADGGISLYRMDGDRIKPLKRGFFDKFFND